jgi:hypothetical protein
VGENTPGLDPELVDELARERESDPAQSPPK